MTADRVTTRRAAGGRLQVFTNGRFVGSITRTPVPTSKVRAAYWYTAKTTAGREVTGGSYCELQRDAIDALTAASKGEREVLP